MNKKYIITLLLMTSSVGCAEKIGEIVMAAGAGYFASMMERLYKNIDPRFKAIADQISSASNEEFDKLTIQIQNDRQFSDREKAILLLILENRKREVKVLQEQQVRLQGEMDQIKKTYADLNDSQQQQFELLQSELAGLDNLNAQLKTKEAELESLRTSNIQLQKDLAAEKGQNEARNLATTTTYDLLVAEVAQLKQDIKNKEYTFQADLQNLKAELASQGIVIGELKATNAILTSENTGLATKLERLQESYRQLEQAEEKLKQVVSESNNTILQKIEECKQSNQKLQELNRQIKELEGQGLRMVSALDALTKETQKYQEKQAELESEIQRVKQELAFAISQLEEEKAQHSQTRDRLQNIEKELAQLRESYDDLERAQVLVEAANNELQIQVISLQSTVRSLEQTQQALEKAKSELEELNGRIVPEKESLMAQVAELQNSYSEIQHLLQASQATEKLSNEKLAISVSQQQAIEDQLQEAQEKLQTLSYELIQCRETLTQKEIALSTALQLYQGDVAEKQRLTQEILELQEENRILEATAERMQLLPNVEMVAAKIEKMNLEKMYKKLLAKSEKQAEKMRTVRKRHKSRVEDADRMLQYEIQSKESRVSELEEEIEKVQQTYEQTIKELKKQLGELQESHTITKTHKEMLLEKIVIAEEKIGQLEAELSNLQQEKDAILASHNGSATPRTSTSRAVNPSMSTLVERMASFAPVDTPESQLRVGTPLTIQRQDELERTQAANEILVENNTTLKSELSQKAKIVEELTVQNKALTEQLKLAQAISSKSTEESDDAEQLQYNKKLVRENEVLKDQIKSLMSQLDALSQLQETNNFLIRERETLARNLKKVEQDNRLLQEEVSNYEEHLKTDVSRLANTSYSQEALALAQENAELQDKSRKIDSLLQDNELSEDVKEYIRQVLAGEIIL